MKETEIIMYHGGENVITIFDSEKDEECQTIGLLKIGFENCSSQLMLTIKTAGSSEMIPLHEITYSMTRNDAYVLLAAVEAYLKMQPLNTKTIVD